MHSLSVVLVWVINGGNPKLPKPCMCVPIEVSAAYFTLQFWGVLNGYIFT